jgi:hypothetical protein
VAKRRIDLASLPTLESMLDRIEPLKSGAKATEVSLPNRMTFHGRLIGRTFSQAVVLDRLLQKGLVPVGSERQDDGQLLKLGRPKPLDPSTLRTEPPPIDITERVPTLAPLAKIATRLHPRRAIDSDPAASKIGGVFLWPRSEPWPRCDDPRHQTGVNGRGSATGGVYPMLVGVVQLNARDFPQVPFRPGTDLLQLLWCTTTEDVHDDAYLFPKLFAYWRDSKSVSDPIDAHPLPDFTETTNNHYPISCRFFPETVRELPKPAGLYLLPNHEEIHAALTADERVWYQYQDDLCACPSTKLGGHPYWIQNDDTPDCACGNKMDFLLQLCDWEYTNMGSTRRWIPLADRWAVDERQMNAAAEAVLRPPYFDFGHEVYYIFVCPKCPDRPVRFVSQR